METYRGVHGYEADLMAYFGGVAWRSAGLVGYDSQFLGEYETGRTMRFTRSTERTQWSTPEKRPSSGPTENLSDIGPTAVPGYFAMTIPGYAEGQPIPNFL